MQTLTYGFKKPQTGDKGSIWFPALADNIQQLNDHTHNGTDSSRLTVASLTTVSATIDSSAWVAVAGQTGTYRRLITIPVSIASLDDCVVSFKHGTSKDVLHLTYEKQSTNTYYLYVNDNTISIIADYGI